MSGRVRGFFAGYAFMALEICDTRNFDGTLAGIPRSCTFQDCVLA